MLHPSHTWATWPSPACELPAVHCRDKPQHHTGDKGTQEHFVGQAGTFLGAGSNAGRVPQFLHSSEVSRSQQTHFMQTHREAKARKDMWGASSPRDWYLTGGRIPTQTKKDLPFWGPALQRCDTAHLFICTWVPTSPELGRLSMLNPLFGSGIPAPAALQFTQFRHLQARFWWQLQS